jgi:ATP-dependent Clp protease protease subunit
MFKSINKVHFNSEEVEESTFLMFGEITTDVAQDFAEFIINRDSPETEEYKRPDVINLMVNSIGGDLHAAYTIIDMIDASTIPVRTIGTGQIASAGLIIFASGHKGYRTLTENTSIMSHQYATEHAGKHHELMSRLKEFEMLNKNMTSHLSKVTGMSIENVSKILLPAQDVFLNANEAKEYGLCDIVVDTLK